MDRKAQGTIEYLVIIAIVVVIALVVVGLLLQIMGNFGGMSESAARAAWKSGTPFAITDYAQDSTNLTIVLQNTSGNTIEFNSFTIETGDTNSIAKSIAAGDTYTITIASSGLSQTCATAGTKYAYPKSGVSIDYNSQYVDSLTQVGAADIVGTCG